LSTLEEEKGPAGNEMLVCSGAKKPKETEDTYVCMICIEEVKLTDETCYKMRCDHFFHRLCLYEYWKNSIRSLSIPLKCPMPDCPQKEVHQSEVEIVIKKSVKHKKEAAKEI
jgi:hypothetical protein